LSGPWLGCVELLGTRQAVAQHARRVFEADAVIVRVHPCVALCVWVADDGGSGVGRDSERVRCVSGPWIVCAESSAAACSSLGWRCRLVGRRGCAGWRGGCGTCEVLGCV
jgi:hypothetical protein